MQSESGTILSIYTPADVADEVHEVEPVMRPLGRTTSLSLLVVEEAVVV
jgi:hypothetical protein